MNPVQAFFQRMKPVQVFLQRMVRASLLDSKAYSEIIADTGATRQALFVVLLMAIATGIGGETAYFTILWIIGWLVWVNVTYLAGGLFFPEWKAEAKWSVMARAMGFAQAPAVLRVLGLIPGPAGVLLSLLSLAWTLVASVAAARQVFGGETSGLAYIPPVIGFIVTWGALWGISVLIVLGSP